MNSVNLIGNLTRDPEVKHTQSGATIVNLGIAWNGRAKQGEEWVDKAHFFDVTCFGDRFEKLAEHLEKGKKVGISGRLDFQQWEQEGVKRSKVAIIASDITFASSKSDSDSAPRAERAPDGYYPTNTPEDDADGIPF